MKKWIMAIVFPVAVTFVGGGAAAIIQAEGPAKDGGTALQGEVGSAFNYQGQLKRNGVAISGAADFQFSLWDGASGGAQIGSTLTITGVAVTDGVFNVDLDFGAGAFDGNERFVQVGVRYPSAGGGGYTTATEGFTTLQPR